MKLHGIQNRLVGLLLLFCGTTLVQAQVTIGKDLPPEKFTILQVESNTGGVRLPELTKEQRDNLAVEGNDEARGLMIFNSETKDIQYWDGIKWVTVFNGGDFTSDELIASTNSPLLGDVKAHIRNKSITLPKLHGAEQADGSDKGKLYATNPDDGSPEFVDPSASGTPINATNGLNQNADFIELGGTLSKNTEIQLESQNLNFTTGGGLFRVTNDLTGEDALTVTNTKVGINNKDPKVMMHINGAFSTKEGEAKWMDNCSSVVQVNDGQATIDSTETAPCVESKIFDTYLPLGVSGQRLIAINNTSKTSIVGLTEDHTLGPDQAIEFAFNEGLWKATSPLTTALYTYASQLRVPPFTQGNWDNHGNATYDTEDWIIVKKEEILAPNKDHGASIQLVYEFVGDPIPGIEGFYPSLCTSNLYKNDFGETTPDTFAASVVKLENKESSVQGGVRTQIKVSISRTDKYGGGGTAEWGGDFNLNIMLIKSAR